MDSKVRGSLNRTEHGMQGKRGTARYGCIFGGVFTSSVPVHGSCSVVVLRSSLVGQIVETLGPCRIYLTVLHSVLRIVMLIDGSPVWRGGWLGNEGVDVVALNRRNSPIQIVGG